MVIIYSAPAVHIEYKCTYNLLARATYVPKNVVAAFRHVIFQCVVTRQATRCQDVGKMLAEVEKRKKIRKKERSTYEQTSG